ncbi:serine/threonine-protein kinase MRCK alpha-like [Paramacrobiotus metropolitanus]|uniref:serine/threonine-protein kinase MRCK alpha-like n=1 Tax=Paramacrobiotus metropolitanus TaxID=2943436 RepID=UPI002445AFC6|nr:serine/threonine-protein kinase MRCK alpha-like [Paramacrobiotus metropolitanus]XP_055343192.1 serine/threonine-protein kinase MRCK alpha-like [Paramacrobiotus metropolitanus]XP_055343193.1 serine/threonine-protein kinase MRCK alpha-like [Paramacrobiotus metropolitanus]XP_055343194.1 serine/threonine-protein kinase MRCK alpha-like [Paramacrobiotus metropolitanus]XP_055343195.1 serine/threonine-protein kinase MRCK alpha-like [Paramacrobiotus metropolitanus]XP_055343196.1 serine/threonine-pro
MSAEVRLKQLEQMFLKGPQTYPDAAVSTETLLDVLIVLYDECTRSTLRKERTFTEFIEHAKPVVAKVRQLRLVRDDFEFLKIIGRGAFGDVAVVRMKSTDRIYAMKILHKWEMLKRAETACFKEERDVLVNGDGKWITNLHYAFQDDEYLYLVMDYYCGGDLLTLLMKFNDRLPEDMARFYVAEMILAIESVHYLRYVHRDIKPDNIVLDANGHIRLADFGSCLKMLSDGTVQCKTTVGTPDYISPEILQAMEDGRGRYGPECDWWSLGICMYEMLFGVTPFYAESLLETYARIMNHTVHLKFPEDVEISDPAKDLMKRLICNAEHRLGKNGLQDFCDHPFFKGIEWKTLRESTPPFIPEVSSPTDTSNFDIEENDVKHAPAKPPNANAVFSGLHLPFAGFTFTGGSRLSDTGNLGAGAEIVTEESPVQGLSAEAYERRIARLEADKRELSRKVVETSQALQQVVHGKLPSQPVDRQTDDNEAVQLRKEVGVKDERIYLLEAQVNDLLKAKTETDGHLERMVANNEKLQQSLELAEGDQKAFKTVRDKLGRELGELEDKLASQNKELKDATHKLKSSSTEIAELNERLEELRSAKQKLIRQLREKDDELEKSNAKVETLRQDIKRADALRKDLEMRNEALSVDISAQRTNVDRQDSQSGPRVNGHTNSCEVDGNEARRLNDEITRLKNELAALQRQSDSDANASRRPVDVDDENVRLREQLTNVEQQRNALQQEIRKLEEHGEHVKTAMKIQFEERARLMKRDYDIEAEALDGDNHRLKREIERLEQDCQSLQDEVSAIKENKADTTKKLLQSVTELNQMLSDEKNARRYLQALMSKLSDEVDTVKAAGLGIPMADSTWRNRKSQKLNKSELLSLQSNLQSEIQAKEQIHQELLKVRTEIASVNRKLTDSEQLISDLRHEIQDKDAQISEMRHHFEVAGNLSESQPSILDRFLKDAAANAQKTESSCETEPTRPLSSYTNDNDVPVYVPPLSMPSQVHKFSVETFSQPTKCIACSSLLVGLMRQGYSCGVCGISCHTHCLNQVPGQCPPHPNQAKRPLGIDPKRGVGTAYEGYLRVPKAGGVKKGWVKQFVVICDFKLFLYDVIPEKKDQPNIVVWQVLDMRDEDFTVSGVSDEDVIHANKKDVNNIFKVTTTLVNPPGFSNQMLFLADNKGDKDKWIIALTELHRILRKNIIPTKTIFRPKEIVDESLNIVKTFTSAAILDRSRLVAGGEEGLFCIDVEKEEVLKIGDTRKITQVEYVDEEQLVIIASGKQHCIRLIPTGALDGYGVDWVKLTDTRGCHCFCVGRLTRTHRYVLCVAMKRHILVYEITRDKGRHRKLREISVDYSPQCLDVRRDKLFVGFQSTFGVFSLEDDTANYLLTRDFYGTRDDASSVPRFLLQSSLNALMAVDITEKEYLFVFDGLGLYLDERGRHCRTKEIMFTAPPLHIAFFRPYLIVYTENHIAVYDVNSGDWVQTLNMKRARPLSRDGSLNLVCPSDSPLIVYLRELQAPADLIMPREVPVYQPAPDRRRSTSASRAGVQRKHRRWSVKSREFAGRQNLSRLPVERRSRLISGPSDFSHVSHVGPADRTQIQQLMDHRNTDRRVSGSNLRVPPSPLRLDATQSAPSVQYRGDRSVASSYSSGMIPSQSGHMHDAASRQADFGTFSSQSSSSSSNRENNY